MSLSNSMVAHKWAHGSEGRGSNFRTDGKRLISYNTDVAYNTGRGLVFISDDNMSPSTGRQLSHARRACSHLDVVYTPVFQYGAVLYDFDEKQAFKMACASLSVRLEGYSKVKLSKYLAQNITHADNQAMNLIGLAIKYGFELPAFAPISDERRAVIAEYERQWAIRDAARIEVTRTKEHARLAVQRERDAADFDAWRHASGPCPSSYRLDADGGYYIAVRGDNVVTSGGAECPIEHARAGVVFWRMREHTGLTEGRVFEPWHRNGQRVQLGVFQLDRIDADGTAFAGCHKFSVAELDRLADILL